jgi:polysaccharide deacetylase 2 family uncharacterized protein YibQ
MPFDLLIRRLLLFVRRYGWDSAFVLLLLAALAFAGAPAWGGLARLARTLSPVMQAQAFSESTVAGADHARLALAGIAGARRYSPQILFPVEAHTFPDWLRAGKGAAAQPAPRSAHPVIAVCIDDLGEDIAGTDKAMALPQAVALSFLPYAETTPFLAAEAARKGHEILAHVPMEAIGPIDPGPMALKVGAPDIAARLAWNIARVPGLVGINNHEGSKFSADAASLLPVAQTLAARHLFFFDSRTGPDTQIVAVARRFGVASAGRDIFLDDTVSEAAIRQQLAALVALARTQGVAIAIGHPHDLTLKVLAAWLVRDQGVTLVPLSQAIGLKSGPVAVAAR